MKPTNEELRELDRIARRYEGHMTFRRQTPKDQWHVPFEDERNTIDMDWLGVAILLILIAFLAVLVFQ